MLPPRRLRRMTLIGTQLISGLMKADTLHLYALDHLSCLAMATQCKRVFSAAKKTLTPERNALGFNILEACECLRWWWWRNEVVTGTAIACPTTTRVQIEAQLVTALLGDAGAVEEDVHQPIFYSPETVWTFPIRAVPVSPVAVIH
jgi:hypothetical protein